MKTFDTPPALAAAVFVCALAGLALPPASSAQQAPEPEMPFAGELRAGLRLGLFDMVNSADSYDAVYGDPLPLAGGQVEWLLRPRLLLGASLAYGEVEGERVLPTDPPIPTGIETSLTYIPVHATVSWRIDRPAPPGAGADWSAWLGGGPSVLSWEDDAGFTSADGTEIGGHLAASLRRGGARWIFGGELLWSSFPDAIGGAGVSELFDEDDLGGVSLTFLALRRF